LNARAKAWAIRAFAFCAALIRPAGTFSRKREKEQQAT
jgi:hypothetical protein